MESTVWFEKNSKATLFYSWINSLSLYRSGKVLMISIAVSQLIVLDFYFWKGRILSILALIKTKSIQEFSYYSYFMMFKLFKSILVCDCRILILGSVSDWPEYPIIISNPPAFPNSLSKNPTNQEVFYSKST